ncbi:MAG: glycosyltransferase family 25 protein [Chlamydiota bacterium]
MAFNQFDAIVYINLSHRHDRNKLLLEELNRLEVNQDKIHRFEAVHDFLNGHRGCAQSHIKVLELAKEKRWKNVLILEDDVAFTQSKEEIEHTISSFLKAFENKWDVFFLGANIFEYEATDYPDFKKVLCAQCAHAYVVNSDYIDLLKNCFHEAYLSMLEDDLLYGFTSKAIDQQWKSLQRQGRWYIGRLLGQQRRSYSDILHITRERYHKDMFSKKDS